MEICGIEMAEAYQLYTNANYSLEVWVLLLRLLCKCISMKGQDIISKILVRILGMILGIIRHMITILIQEITINLIPYMKSIKFINKMDFASKIIMKLKNNLDFLVGWVYFS